MEIVSGYFISRDQAVEAAEYLRERGFKGKISVIGWHNEEDSYENGNTDDTTGIPGFGITGGLIAATAGLTVSTFSGMGPLVALPIVAVTGMPFDGEIKRVLIDWGVPESEWSEIKDVVKSRNSVILVECEYSDRSYIKEILQYKGAQNIHI